MPTVKWYREGKENEETHNVSSSFDQSSGLATLIIRNVTYTDSAKYTCVARNVIGSCSSSATLTVKGFYFYFSLIWLFLTKHGVILTLN